ncbi:hypothetical protein ACO9S2_04090 [Nitrospira sp. NS4]|uniref:hypothetical protein n=1 Tax=Nitrospira sp. NS4 TaxID=3414498 RepID=UPI003C30AA9F
MASKVLERIFVEGFLPRLGSGYAILEERESPDFLVSDGEERFGLEVAQVFRDQSPTGSPTKAAESRRVQYLRRLASDYYSRSGLPLLVTANIPNRFSMDTSVVADRLKTERPAVHWTRSRFEMNSATFYLTSLPSEAGAYSRWRCGNNSVGWRGWLTAADVEPVIGDKASKLSSYRVGIARVELLLVVDVVHTSGLIRWRDGTPHPAAHGFDAVHLYFHPEEARRLA